MIQNSASDLNEDIRNLKNRKSFAGIISFGVLFIHFITALIDKSIVSFKGVHKERTLLKV